MARPQRLNEAQIAELFDPPTEQRDLVRHFTLSEADLGAIRRCRGDHNRLGYALMLCYLRHPGRVLRSGERPPPILLAFVAEQIGIIPDAVDKYLAAERNRRRHAVECQEQLGLRPFGKLPPPNWQASFCRKPSRMIGSPVWQNWQRRHAGNAGSSSRRRPRSSGSAPSSATRPVGKSIAG